MSKLNDLTIGEAKELAALFGGEKPKTDKPHPFQVGKNYFIRTVTMSLIGKLEAVFDNELVLSTPAWIADTGRIMDCLMHGEKAMQDIEPFLDDIIIGRNSIIDATIWNHELPTEQK